MDQLDEIAETPSRKQSSLEELVEEVRTGVTVHKYEAGWVKGWGRKMTDKAAAAGILPVLTAPSPRGERVRRDWLRADVGIS